MDADNAYGANLRENWGVMVQYDSGTDDSMLICVTIGKNTYLD